MEVLFVVGMQKDRENKGQDGKEKRKEEAGGKRQEDRSPKCKSSRALVGLKACDK